MLLAVLLLLITLIVGTAGVPVHDEYAYYKSVVASAERPFGERVAAANWLDRLTNKESDRKNSNYSSLTSPLAQRLGMLADGDPFGVTVSIGDNQNPSTLMHVMWRAKGPRLASGVVNYGLSSSNLNLRATVYEIDSYTREDMCGASGSMNGSVYKANIAGLTANTKYYYRVGFESSNQYSRTFSFITRPTPGSVAAENVNFLLYGDMGGPWAGGGDRNAEAMIERGEIERNAFTLHIGDITYADGTDEFWDEFALQVEDITANHPYLVTVGNHEGEDSEGECFVPALKRYHAPASPDFRDDAMLAYSFTWGPIKFVVMSTEHDFSRGSAIHDFVVGEFENIDRDETPWLLFLGHKCMYSEQDDDFDTLFREEMEEELVDHRVDLSVCGHKHDWQRFCSIIDSECVQTSQQKGEYYVYDHPPAPVHLVVGMGGRNFDDLGRQSTDDDDDEILEMFIESLGYGKFHANATHLVGEFIEEAGDGKVADAFMIIK